MLAAKTATAAVRDIPSDRDAALADRASRTLDALICGTEPVSARFGVETVSSCSCVVCRNGSCDM